MAARRARGLARELVVLCATLALSSVRAAQDSPELEAPTPPASEGALDNDVFVPVSDAAAAALQAGDKALARARAARERADEAARLLDEACEHWHDALDAGAGASVWFDPAPAARRRLSEGALAGVRRRLLALSDAERARWTQRFAEASTRALAELARPDATGRRDAELAEVVRRFPLTEGAARAALLLSEAALESGRAEAARAWLARGEREAREARATALLTALAARRAALAPVPEPVEEAWRRARAIEPTGSLVFDPQAATPAAPRRFGAGAAFLGPHEVALQTATDVLFVSLAGGAPAVRARIHPLDFLVPYSPELAPTPTPPGWSLLPAARDGQLVLVVGRTTDEGPNALLLLDVPPAAAHQTLGLELARTTPAARLAWAIVGGERLTPAGASPVAGLEGLPELEFQPGPILCADRILVQARSYQDQTRGYLLAFERLDGTLAWARLLASGADLVPADRFAAQTKRLAAEPLLALGASGEPRAFAGTQLGLGVLLDGLLGEPLWSFRNRRRDVHDPGWGGDRPVASRSSGGEDLVLWAPADSDRSYALAQRPAAPAADGTLDEESAVLVAPPLPIQDAERLLDGDGDALLVLGRRGKRRTLTERRGGRDRVDALELGSDERFGGTGRASPERAWVSSDRALYLFDRGRELYLLDSAALAPAGGAPTGGDVLCQGEHVLVLGPTCVWSFLAR